MNATVKKALVFAILMQDIEGKSPGYIREKWDMVHGLAEPEGLLDTPNTEKLAKWEKRWEPKKGGA